MYHSHVSFGLYTAVNYECQLDVPSHSPAASDLSGIPDGRIAGNARATAGSSGGNTDWGAGSPNTGPIIRGNTNTSAAFCRERGGVAAIEIKTPAGRRLYVISAHQSASQ